MRLVVVESPFAARNPDGSWDHETVEENLRYCRAAMNDCLLRNESPYASHSLYTQPGVLNDQVPEERNLGMKAGFAWNKYAEASVVYIDRGISSGMRAGIKNAVEHKRPIEIRSLSDWSNNFIDSYRLAVTETIGNAYLEVSKDAIIDFATYDDNE